MKKIIMLSIILLALFFTPQVEAQNRNDQIAAATGNLRARQSPCPITELAIANTNGTVTHHSCHANLNDARNTMNGINNDDMVLIEGGRIVDAKYGFINFDQNPAGRVTDVFNDRGLTNRFTYISSGPFGTNGDDAVLLEVDYPTRRVRIKVGGVIGWIALTANGQTQYDVLPLAWTSSYTMYRITNDDIRLRIPGNLFSTRGVHELVIGVKPTNVATGDYFSYDGKFFYRDIKTMINDYKAGHFNNAVNSVPYYNYYQFVSFRTKTKYSAANINQFIESRTSANSVLRNTGHLFKAAEEKYGINAILMLAIAINESGWGTSNFAVNRNNLFGLNAIDADPGQASFYASLEDCIDTFAYVWLSYGYLLPGDGGGGSNRWRGRFRGSALGHKGMGLNVMYASDIYWGAKAAQFYYSIDRMFGFQDYESTTVGLLNNHYDNVVYAKRSPGGENISTAHYQYRFKDSPVNIVAEVQGPAVNGNTTWYRIMSDPLAYNGCESRCVPRPAYNWSNNFAYVPAAYFHIVKNGSIIDSNNRIQVIVSASGYTYGNGTISGIRVGTPVEEVRKTLSDRGALVVIESPSGDQNGANLIGTGFRVTITREDVTETLTVILPGDTSGDGTVNASDFVRIRNHIMGSLRLEGPFLKAADVDNDGQITASDFVHVRNFIMQRPSVIR